MFFGTQNARAGAKWKRALLSSADYSGDPVAGGKLISVYETPGKTGSTIVTTKNGMNSTAERQPDNQPYWLIDVTGEIDWTQNQNIELALEMITNTTSATDIMNWWGMCSDINQANWTTRGSWYGYRHSVVFLTNPMFGAYSGSLFYTTQANASNRNLYSHYNSPKGDIKQAMLGGLRTADWDQITTDIRGAAPILPANPSDPAYLAFTSGSMRNVALGGGADVVTEFRLWYRITKYEPN